MIVERKDPKRFLLERVLAVVSTRRAQQEFSKYEITPITHAAEALKIALMAMFFSVDYAFIVQELKDRKKLRKFMGIRDFPSIETVYSIF